MSRYNISIFGNKIFSEILDEVKIFSNFTIKYYDDLNLCINEAEKKNFMVIFFVRKSNLDLFRNKELNNFPSLFVTDFSVQKNKFLTEFNEQIKMPFSIIEFNKKIISLFAKYKFKKNSLIQLKDYTINKNERKIKKNTLELQLSEKEINFLILFSKSTEPMSKKFVLKNVWNYSSESETHTVETHVHRLRKKILKKFGDSNFIKINNRGYYI
jgi:DNA-binding response OmpR family regulator